MAVNPDLGVAVPDIYTQPLELLSPATEEDAATLQFDLDKVAADIDEEYINLNYLMVSAPKDVAWKGRIAGIGATAFSLVGLAASGDYSALPIAAGSGLVFALVCGAVGYRHERWGYPNKRNIDNSTNRIGELGLQQFNLKQRLGLMPVENQAESDVLALLGSSRVRHFKRY